MSLKVDTFFEFIRAIYGAAKFKSAWSDDTHLQAAKIMWTDLIEKHDEGELSIALDNAKDKLVDGDKDWMFPNVGLILSGARNASVASHRKFLTGREETKAEREFRVQVGKQRVRDILKNLDMPKVKPSVPDKLQENTDLW